MRCPACGGEMEGGDLEVKGTVAGFFLFGRSWQHLWWRHPTGRQKLIPSGARARAARCVECGVVAFDPADVDPHVPMGGR